MDTHLISIIVPIYKVETYLEKCIVSILSQTLRDIEIILVDDGSPDNCGKICDSYASKDSRIVVIHKKNGGLSSARNAGIDIAKGEYLMFVDSDDYVEPDFCEKAYHLVVYNNVLCASFGYYEHWNDRTYELHTSKEKTIPAIDAIKSLIIKNDVIYNFAWNKIYHKSLFNSIRYPEGRYYEDQGTTYKLFDAAKLIYVDPSMLYHYNRRQESITQALGIEQTKNPIILNDLFDLWCERLEFVENNYPDLKNNVINQITVLIVRSFNALTWKNDKAQIIKFEQFLNIHKKEIVSLKIQSKWVKLYLKLYYCSFELHRFVIKHFQTLITVILQCKKKIF